MQPQFIARLSAKLVVALGLLLGVASQASAATITATFAGTVKTGLDSTGVFGTPGANLAGVNYSLVYTADPTVGDYSTFNGTIFDPQLSGDQIFLGISAALTINGHSYSFIGSNSPGGNFDLFATKPGVANIWYQVQNSSTFSQVSASLATNNPAGFPTSVLGAGTLTSCPAGLCSFRGSFNIPTSGVASFTGYLNFGSFTVGPTPVPATTPIPATLPLLVSALGGLGFVGWRRKQAAAA
jgi:hypothetical protein